MAEIVTVSYRTKHLVFSGRRKKDRDPMTYCFCCGQPTQGKIPRMIHVVNGGYDVLHPGDESVYESDAGEMGCFAIGPRCARALGVEWTFRMEL